MAMKLEQRYLDTVPDFYGNGNELSYFIKVAEALVTRFYNSADPLCYDNFVLIANIRSKIKGEALSAISNHAINSWTDLKNALINSYADKRDCYTLAIEIANLRQHNESAFEYHNKMLGLLNAHTAYIETQIDEKFKPALITYGQNLAIRSFLKGLKDPLKSLLQSRNPTCLNTALRILTNDFQFESQRAMNKPTIQQIPNRPIPKQNFKPLHKPVHVPNFEKPQSSFPRGPVQIKQMPKPTPMSISTRQTWQKPQNYQNSRFQQQSRPTFVSKELFNLETDDQPSTSREDPRNFYEGTENIEDNVEENYFLDEAYLENTPT